MKKVFRYKFFSGALQFTIFIGVIIALVLAGLVMLQNTHNFFIQQSKAAIENIQLSNAAIVFLKHQDDFISDTITLDQLSDNNHKVQVQYSQWGIYGKAVVKTTHREKVFYKSALLGTQIENQKRPTLYLQDNFKPLVVVGNAILKGAIFLPSQGIKPGYIVGESYYGKELVYGSTKLSSTKLPVLKEKYREALEGLLRFQEMEQRKYLGGNEILKYKNSFLKSTKFWHSSNIIVLDDNMLSGNIIIKSDEKIVVKKKAILKDVILIAPIIEVQDGFDGCFQAIANKQIRIGKDCKLNYPSALVFIQEKDEVVNLQKQNIPIIIDRKTELRGSIIYFKSIKDNDFKTQVALNEEAVVKGEIYCQGNLELSGKVVGSVYTEQFLVNKAGTVFINHIYNGQIVDDNFPEAFSGLLFENSTKGVVKWMY